MSLDMQNLCNVIHRADEHLSCGGQFGHKVVAITVWFMGCIVIVIETAASVCLAEADLFCWLTKNLCSCRLLFRMPLCPKDTYIQSYLTC